jgi:hypothetical protein
MTHILHEHTSRRGQNREGLNRISVLWPPILPEIRECEWFVILQRDKTRLVLDGPLVETVRDHQKTDFVAQVSDCALIIFAASLMSFDQNGTSPS